MPDLSDPDHIALIYLFGIDSCLYTGPLDEARRVAEAHDEVTSGLTPHHRLHAVRLLIAVEQAEGRWEAARNLTSRAEPAVADSVATPCIANVAALLALALANVLLGDDREARRLEREAEGLGMRDTVPSSTRCTSRSPLRGAIQPRSSAS